ncbi:MAG: thioredoxin-dependent thiol peroxidase [Pseudomonadota bacterium]
MVEIGNRAPNFSVPGAGGKTITLSDYEGDWVVLYFYPKDDTPGCTTEAKDFSALSDQFKARGAQIIGVSKDTVKKHDRFRDKHGLTVDLASDETGNVCTDYGVWVEKNMYGKTYMGIQRATFLIDPDGNIAEAWPKVKVNGHAAEVLDRIPHS